MKDLRGQARVSAFLRKSLAEGAQDVLKLEAMARRETLLGERQRLTDAKAFKRAKYSLRIRSVRAGFGPNGRWRWGLPWDREWARQPVRAGRVPVDWEQTNAPQHGLAYSITSSAVESSVGGTARPSILAVQALMTNSNLVDCTTGKSAGFAPLRMRPA